MSYGSILILQHIIFVLLATTIIFVPPASPPPYHREVVITLPAGQIGQIAGLPLCTRKPYLLQILPAAVKQDKALASATKKIFLELYVGKPRDVFGSILCWKKNNIWNGICGQAMGVFGSDLSCSERALRHSPLSQPLKSLRPPFKKSIFLLQLCSWFQSAFGAIYVTLPKEIEIWLSLREGDSLSIEGLAVQCPWRMVAYRWLSPPAPSKIGILTTNMFSIVLELELKTRQRHRLATITLKMTKWLPQR